MNYQKKLSGPLLDRVDLVVEVPRQKMANGQNLESPSIALHKTEKTETIRAHIGSARQIQKARFQPLLGNEAGANARLQNSAHPKSSGSHIRTNSQMGPAAIKTFCQLNHASQEMLQQACEKLNLSHRNHHQLLKVARTIADLESHDHIQLEDLTEALQYRFRYV